MHLVRGVVGHLPAAARLGLRRRLHPAPFVAVRVVGQRLARAAFAAEDERHLLVAVPRGAAQRRDVRRGQRTHVAPFVCREVVGPDRRVVQIDLAPPLPAVAAAEGRKADVAVARTGSKTFCALQQTPGGEMLVSFSVHFAVSGSYVHTSAPCSPPPPWLCPP